MLSFWGKGCRLKPDKPEQGFLNAQLMNMVESHKANMSN